MELLSIQPKSFGFYHSIVKEPVATEVSMKYVWSWPTSTEGNSNKQSLPRTTAIVMRDRPLSTPS